MKGIPSATLHSSGVAIRPWGGSGSVVVTHGNRDSPTGTVQRPVDDLTNQGAPGEQVEALQKISRR